MQLRWLEIQDSTGLFCSRSRGVSTVVGRHRRLIAGIALLGDSALLLPPLSCCPAVALAGDSGLLSPSFLVALCIALDESLQLSLSVGSESGAEYWQ